MSQTSSSTSVEQLLDRITAGTERLLQEAAPDGSDETRATIAELLDVVEEVDDLLETIDFERLPDAVDVSALPDLVGRDGFANAVREREPDLALDLSTIRDVIELRGLWNTVDIADFLRELRQLETELEDVVGPGYAGRKPVSNNPTAVSSVPYGPLPASVSTRVSTVPTNVRHAKVDALPRIYSRRWTTAGRSK
ncbi:hypothetical protein [Natrinema longum]|uniref:Uncharacterized protein n=1 Tax=Natrinema longum TaxID=370324 RepID=A0A8A2UED8_9EURY|nr:hypothetical protein [Natrinema longum]MBZ6495475.1 hypothetical protein [Natrinema longum]QSW86555.1 hypothetical protein J0X27_06995 [Natrinema longum]